MKRILSLCLSLMILSSLNVVAADNGAYEESLFSDVKSSHWAFDYIKSASTDGVVNGYADGTFKPENSIKRSEWAKIIFAMEDLTVDEMAATAMDLGTDLDPSKWYAFMMFEVRDYLIPEIDDSEGEAYRFFNPEENATRAEVAASLGRIKMGQYYHNVEEKLDSFSDSYAIPKEHRTAVAVAIDSGIINGYDDGTFRPLEPVTRAEAITMLYRAYGDKKSTVDIGEDRFAAKKGEYSIGQSYFLNIYEVSESGEVYFDVFWVGLNSFGGVAKSVSPKKASFEITDVEGNKVTGSLISEGNNVIVEITNCTLRYIEPGKESYDFIGAFDKNYTSSGAFMNSQIEQANLKHEFFELFVECYGEGRIKTGEFLGPADHMFNFVISEEDVYSTDFYKVTMLDSQIKYYALCIEKDEYSSTLKLVAYEVMENGNVKKAWEYK